ncbi:LysR family transcriptional regulator [uncultured Albimonas sp.]|uniref:LysR family transcriptional regulator n=1 Tax=uncultured Albimonas sp. TaxID=1331701 RepID=UPI0030EC92A4|tara:strand:- start:702 stop:1586 length:885 start_codon:yes stop_codon:yes gene_type:complete
MLLDQLRVFLRICELGSLAAAGRALGLAPATVSERLSALEAHYGANLIQRTTRALSLTEEGRILAEAAPRLLAEAEEIETRLRHGAQEVSGPIRLSAPLDLGRNRVARILEAFQEAHPRVVIDLHLSDAYVDLAAQGFDLAVRYGDLADSALRVRRLAPSARIVCAAPSYLARRGRPERPEDLARHDCLGMRFGALTDSIWPFVIEGKQRQVVVHPRLQANDGGLVRAWCVAGRGLARKAWWDVADDLAAGRLVPLLRAYETPAIGLQLVYPKDRGRIRRVALLIEALAVGFKA